MNKIKKKKKALEVLTAYRNRQGIQRSLWQMVG
jgi:hypothetical protein